MLLGKDTDEGSRVTVRSTASLGIKQVVVSHQSQAEEFQSDPLVHGEVPLEQWRRDSSERFNR